MTVPAAGQEWAGKFDMAKAKSIAMKFKGIESEAWWGDDVARACMSIATTTGMAYRHSRSIGLEAWQRSLQVRGSVPVSCHVLHFEPHTKVFLLTSHKLMTSSEDKTRRPTHHHSTPA
jgi:hypothetical protein